MRKLEALRGVHGHQLHRVLGELFLDLDVAIQFVEVAEVFDEIAKLFRFVFSLPLLHEFDQPVQVLPVRLRSQRCEPEIPDQFVE